jgi:thymidylate synthase
MKTGMMPGDFVHTFGDGHVYTNQIEKLNEQLERAPKRYPTLLISGVGDKQDWSDVDNYEFEVLGYDCHPVIKFPGAAV